jgi:hypothetical protein
MGEKDLTALKYIGFVVLGNLLLVLALFFLAARRWGWRQTLRQIGEWTLVVSVYFGLFIFGATVLLSPCFSWVTLYTHFNAGQIAEEGITIERFIRPHTVVFSNGESRSVGFLPYFVYFILAFSWWGLDVWITVRVMRRFAPSVYAEFSRNRRTV